MTVVWQISNSVSTNLALALRRTQYLRNAAKTSSLVARLKYQTRRKATGVPWFHVATHPANRDSFPCCSYSWPCTPQFSQITQVPFPPVYERFLEITGIFSFDLGWMLSAACLATGIDFYGKLL